MDPKLEEVFKISGVPTYTFVEPLEYQKLLVALRTPGRGVIIEGPSGIGKTTAVTRALSELNAGGRIEKLSARKAKEIPRIAELPQMENLGTVLIDDFHRLSDTIQRDIADFMKTLADEERADIKIIVVGINKAGQSLINYARDLNNRLDTIRFEVNPDDRVRLLLERGEEALNISMGVADDIVESSNGSFYIAQMLAHATCLEAGLLERATSRQTTNISFEVVRSRVIENLERSFQDVVTDFASGTKLRREGRAPYLNILKWLAEADDWSIDLDRAVRDYPDLRGSVGQVVDKGYLEGLIGGNPKFASVLHYHPKTHVLTVEDPQFVFYLRNVSWNKLARRIGFFNIEFDSRYDFALSFAGADRAVAQRLFEKLSEYEFEVFYDKNEQHRILAENVEDYLGPIYRSEAEYVVCLLSPEFPKRIWTKFESEQFKKRFGENSVIPIWFTTSPPGLFDESARVGGMTFDPAGDAEAQLNGIVETLRKRMAEDRVRSP